MGGKAELDGTFVHALLDAAKAIADARPSVLTYGVGRKESRSDDRGLRHAPCLKFVVPRKSANVAADQRVPEFVTVSFRGAHHRVPTDVVSRFRIPARKASDSDEGTALDAYGALHDQSLRCLVGSGPAEGRVSDGEGIPGFVVRASNSSHLLVTAGHVLLERGFARPQHGRPVYLGPPTTQCGSVVAPLSYLPLPSGPYRDAFADVGIVSLGSRVPPRIQELLDRPPWAHINRIASLDEVLSLTTSQPVHFQVYGNDENGSQRPYTAAFRGSYVAPLRLNVAPPWGAPRVDRDYGPILLESEASAAANGFFGGDSGTPLVHEGALYGLHFAGVGHATKTGNARGLALAATSILDYLNAMTGLEYEYVPVRGARPEA